MCCRNIRNLNKKIALSAKADSVVAENPGQSLDELVAARKLNNDQRAQLLRKPQLQAQVTQLEEQLNQCRNITQELEDKFSKEKASLIEAHEAEVAQLKEDAAKQAGSADGKNMEDALMVISQFLHAAAAKRQSEDADSDEGRAFEGALLLVYQGDSASLSTIRSLIEGSDEKVPDVQGELLDYTFAQIKQSAMADAPALTEENDEPVDEPVETAEEPANESDANVPPTQTSTDPTIANAGMTELDDNTTVVDGTNGEMDSAAFAAPEQTSITDDAANAVAQANWDPEASMTTNGSGEGWVEVPRDPAETETGIAATPAAMQNVNSWAEEVAEEKPLVQAENDGFSEVKGRERGRGRGRGGRGDGRGRGRGRGDGFRGGQRRGRGAPRGGQAQQA